MRPMRVVVVDVDAKDTFKLSAAADQERFDSEEVAGDDRVGVSTHEVAPAELGASTGRRHAGLPQDLGDRRCRHAHSDTGEFTDDPLVAPARILTREPQHELTNRLRYRR